jgi:chromosome partitioning protein
LKVITVFNQKGGCGKTTTCTNLAAALTKHDKKVLIIDMDPQANSTVALGIDDEALEVSIYNLLVMKKITEADVLMVIKSTQFENLSILPSDITLSDAEISLSNVMSRELILKKILETIKDHYDYVIIDCPPSLGLLSINALCASEHIIIPVSPAYFSMKGIKHLLDTIKEVQDGINGDLKIMGVALTLYDSRKTLAKDIRDTLSSFFEAKFFKTIVRVDSQIEYSQDNQIPVVFYNAKSKGYEDYMNLALEVLNHE